MHEKHGDFGLDVYQIPTNTHTTYTIHGVHQKCIFFSSSIYAAISQRSHYYALRFRGSDVFAEEKVCCAIIIESYK